MNIRTATCMVLMMLLNGCVSDLLTGANLVYDRHHVYIKWNDFKLGAAANRILYKDTRFKCRQCALEVGSFHGDLLVVGHVPTEALRQEAEWRLSSIQDKRHFFNELRVYSGLNDPLLDSWITFSVRSRIFADATIDPQQFKVITSDQVVYLMGDAIYDQAQKVLLMTRGCPKVQKVVNLLNYYRLSEHETS